MRKYRIPRKERKLWLEALESGKYQQARSELVRGNSYCCLGLYGRIVGLGNTDMEDEGLPYHLKEEFSSKYPKCLLGKGGKSFGMKLANMNDTYKSFKEIAKYVRKHTIGV